MGLVYSQNWAVVSLLCPAKAFGELTVSTQKMSLTGKRVSLKSTLLFKREYASRKLVPVRHNKHMQHLSCKHGAPSPWRDIQAGCAQCLCKKPHPTTWFDPTSAGHAWYVCCSMRILVACTPPLHLLLPMIWHICLPIHHYGKLQSCHSHWSLDMPGWAQQNPRASTKNQVTLFCCCFQESMQLLSVHMCTHACVLSLRLVFLSVVNRNMLHRNTSHQRNHQLILSSAQ